MDNLNFNEDLDNMLRETSESLNRNKVISTKRLIEMFFVKTAMLIVNSKSTKFTGLNEDSLDKNIMSNIETFYTNYLQNEEMMKIWENIDLDLLLSSSGKKPPPLVIETYLDLINLEPNQYLYIRKSDTISPSATSFSNNIPQIASSYSVCKGGKKTEVVIERWLLELDTTDSTPDALHFDTYDSASYESSLDEFINNKFLIFLRYLISLLKVLPSQELFEKLNNEEKTGKFPPIKVCTRILDGSKPILSKGRIGLSKPIIHSSEPHLQQKNVIPLETEVGLLRVNVSYRKNVNFFVTDQAHAAASAASHKQSKPVGVSHPAVQPGAHISLYNSPAFQQVSSESFSSLLSAEQHIGSGGRKSIISNTSNMNRGSLQYQSTFKVSSVGSVASNNLTRNPSNSSVIANIRAHRSSNALATAGNNLQNQVSNDSIESFTNTDNNVLSLDDQNSTFKSEQIKPRPGLKSDKKLPKTEFSVAMSRKNSDLYENSPEIKEFLDLISDDDSKTNSMMKSTSLMTSNSNANGNMQSITDSLMKFKMMKADHFGGDSNNLGSAVSQLESSFLVKRRNMSSSSMFDSHQNITDKKKQPSISDEGYNQTEFTQYGLSPTRGFDADQLRATLDRSRRGSLDSSKRIAMSNSRNSLYSHFQNDKDDQEDHGFIPGLKSSYNNGANDFGAIGSFSSVTSPRDINTRRPRGASSSSSGYSLPKFYNSLTSNRMSGSPGSNVGMSFSSSQNASRRASHDHYSEPVIEPSHIYANFEKPRSYSKNSNSSLAVTRKALPPSNNQQKPLPENEANSLKHNDDNEDYKKSCDATLLQEKDKKEYNYGKNTKGFGQPKNTNSSLNNDDEDLLFFMGDSS